MALMTRRRLLLAASALPFAARAEDGPITVWWKDLIPAEGQESDFFSTLREMGLLQLGQKVSPWAVQPPAAMVRDYDEKVVRIPGYIIPLAFDGLNVTEGLLVPYVGACIHVPPPPANQIVYVTLAEPKEEAALWDPVWATGVFSTKAIETELAEVGYHMELAVLEPYTG